MVKMGIFKLFHHLPFKCLNTIFPSIRRGIHLTDEHLQQDKISKHSTKILSVTDPGMKLSLNLHPTWLRDHCRCSECYNKVTFQRKQDILTLDELAVGVANYSFDGNVLNVDWKDGHRSIFSLEWLVKNSFDGKKNDQANRRQITTWDGASVKNLGLEKIVYDNLMGQKETLREVYRRVLEYGFAKIEQVPPTEKDTKRVIEYICRMSHTLFGTFWETGTHFNHKDTGYLNGYLEAHTDNTYFSEAQGYLVFHCTHFDGTGGESLLVDGFHVAKQLQLFDSAAYDYLSTTNIESEYLEPAEHFFSFGPCLRHNPINHQLEQIRFNMLDRAPVTIIPPSEIDVYYRHLKTMASIVRRNENEYWFHLKPGTVVIFDNWRLLHGRASYQGNRVLRGCYYSRSDFMSKARSNGIIC